MDRREQAGRQGKELSSTRDLRLRRAEQADCAALSALAFRSKASNGYDEAFMAACRDELAVTPETLTTGETWLAEDESGTVLGFFDLRFEEGLAEVWALFVAPEAKRSGIGRMMWETIERRAQAYRCDRLALDADPFAMPFYRTVGLRQAGEAPSLSIPGRMLPRMEKRLTE